MKHSLKRLLLLGLFFSGLVASAQAAITIRFFTKVKNYNDNNWIEIMDGAPKATPAKINGKWVTDRVERGQPLLIKFADRLPNGRYVCEFVDAAMTTKGNFLKKWPDKFIPYEEIEIKVPTDPNADDVYIRVKTDDGKDQVKRRIPIGGR